LSSRSSRRADRADRAGTSAGRPDEGGRPAEPGEPTQPAAAGQPTRPVPTGSVRAGRRERSRVTYKKSFTERYRSALIGLAAVVAVALIGVFVFSSASASSYACSTTFEPAPSASPSAGSAARPGYVQEDMGKRHASIGEKVTYTFCPPASGAHYNRQGSGPIAARLYGPGDGAVPQGWIHNLEHGGLVLLYRGDGEGATDAGQQALRGFFDTFPDSPLCGFKAGVIGPVIARFDEMATPYAAMVWGRVLPLQTLDNQAILDFWNTWGERTNPEEQPGCDPRTSPVPSSSAAPAASPSTAAPAGPSSVPSVSPAASPSPG
jgi:hypothetical protein